MATDSPHDSLTPTDARLIDQICDRFEAAWKCEEQPRIEEYLAQARDGLRSLLLEQLLLLERQYRSSLGESPTRGEYASRLPADTKIINDVFDQPTLLGDVSTRGNHPGGIRDTTLAAPGSACAGVSVGIGQTFDAAWAKADNDDARYELLEEIGAGGIGRVFRARDHHLRRELAVKVLRKSCLDHPDILHRFVAEAQIGAQLQHTCIAPVYELGRFEDESPFLAMKLVRGKTLSAMLSARRDPTENLSNLLAVFEQVCQAIAYAHARGVIHRDLKPGNIMVGEFGEVQVMDWGLAKVLAGQSLIEHDTSPHADSVGSIRTHRSDTDEYSSQVGLIIGTPAYMPPEQSRGEIDEIDQRADVFSLGAILCEILTGQPPYVGESTDEVCRLSQRGDVSDSHQRINTCSAEPALRDLAVRCLAVDPRRRPENAGIVVHELAAHLASVEERLQHEKLAVEQQKLLVTEERKRRKLWMGLAAAILLATCLAGVAGLAWQRSQSEKLQQLALTRQRIESDLLRAKSRILAHDMPGAWLDWNRAAGRTVLDAAPDLRESLAQLKRDLDFAEELDKARLLRSARKVGDVFDYQASLDGYESAFANYGLKIYIEELDLLARRMKDSVVKGPMLAALNDWALVCEYLRRRQKDAARQQEMESRRNQLLQLARRINADRQLDRIYDPTAWDGKNNLDQFARQLDTANASPQLFNMLGELLEGGSREAMWRAGQANHPNDFWLNFDLGYQIMDKSPADASGFFRAALAIRPDVVTAQNNLGVCYHKLGRIDEALVTLQRAIKLDSDYAPAHLNLGNVLIEKRDTAGAIKHYQTALRLQPDGRIWSNLAAIYRRQGNRKEALRAIREAIRLSPDLAIAHFNLGVILQDDGQLEKAIDSYRVAARLVPENTESRTALGELLAHIGRHAEAVDTWKQVTRLNPQDAHAYFRLAEARLGQGDVERAARGFGEAIRLKPTWSLPHYNLANILKQQKKYQPAIVHYRKAIELQPDFDSAYVNLGIALKNSGDLKSAVAAYRAAIHLRPGEVDAHYNLGLALRAAKDYEGAIASFRKALEIDPRDSQSHKNLGESLAALGRRDEAVQHYQQAVEINPQYVRARIGLLRELVKGCRFSEVFAQLKTWITSQRLIANHELHNSHE